MEIKEAMELKEQLQADILSLLEAYHKVTGLCPGRISMEPRIEQCLDGSNVLDGIDRVDVLVTI